MGKFVIHQTDTGFVFHLKAANGETIATSEVYSSKSSCLSGIDSVKENAPKAALEDQTLEQPTQASNPKFEVYMAKDETIRFRLLARNGQNIAASQGYTVKESCLKGITSVRENAPEAEVIEEEA